MARNTKFWIILIIIIVILILVAISITAIIIGMRIYINSTLTQERLEYQLKFERYKHDLTIKVLESYKEVDEKYRRLNDEFEKIDFNTLDEYVDELYDNGE